MELLMVMVIAPVILLAVYSNFSQGARLWTRLSQAGPAEDVSLFYVKVGRDLRGMLRYESIPFEAEKTSVIFPAAIDAPQVLGGDRGIGSIRIFYDADTRTVKREIKDVSQLHREAEGITTVVLRGVNSFEFSYFTSAPLEDDLFWTSVWSPEPKKLPIAVRMKFTIEEGSWPYERTEFIPAGGLIK